MVRMGFATLLGAEPDFQVVAEAEDGAQAVALFREYRPDVTLMDARMPGGGGVQALEQIRTEFPEARVVMLTTYDLEGNHSGQTPVSMLILRAISRVM
jgi:DNA-binding NarL/FixJ family response regulator